MMVVMSSDVEVTVSKSGPGALASAVMAGDLVMMVVMSSDVGVTVSSFRSIVSGRRDLFILVLPFFSK